MNIFNLLNRLERSPPIQMSLIENKLRTGMRKKVKVHGGKPMLIVDLRLVID